MSRTKQVQNVDLWNKLLIADQEPELLEELNRVISDSSTPDGPDYNTNSSVGEISEAPTTVPGTDNKEVVPSYAYVKI